MAHVTKLGAGGRLVLPAHYRRALKLCPGDELLVTLDEGEIRISTKAQARKRAQDYVCRLVPKNVSLVKELLEERREEVVSATRSSLPRSERRPLAHGVLIHVIR